MRTITALTRQKHNTERINIFLDGEFAFGLNELDAASLCIGQTLSDEAITALQDKDAIVQAVDHAVRFLSYRPRSIEEIRQNLTKRGCDETVITLALERLTHLGYVDDLQFARFWVENRDTFKPRGAVALRHELRQKGVPDAIIQQVLDETLDEADAAYRAAEQRSHRFRGSTQQDFKRKLGAFLQRRGFQYSSVSQALDQLIEACITDDPAFFADDTVDEENTP